MDIYDINNLLRDIKNAKEALTMLEAKLTDDCTEIAAKGIEDEKLHRNMLHMKIAVEKCGLMALEFLDEIL